MPTLVNICSASRSGSTMLDVMLGGGRGAFSCGEVYAWFRPWRRHHFTIDCSCGKQPCPTWQRIGPFPERQFHARTCEALSLDFIIDSSKNAHWVFDNNRWAAHDRMPVINLLLWRSPLGLAYSQWRRGAPLDAWCRPFILYYDRLLRLGLPLTAVCYDDLVRDPSGQLQGLCRQIGMPYMPGQERLWEREYHFLFGSPSVRAAIRCRSGCVRPQAMPPDFRREFEAHEPRLRVDMRLQACLERLQAITRSGAPQAADRTPFGRARLAVWQAGERLTRRWHRWFPASVPAD